jgi:hypothetical protein
VELISFLRDSFNVRCSITRVFSKAVRKNGQAYSRTKEDSHWCLEVPVSTGSSLEAVLRDITTKSETVDNVKVQEEPDRLELVHAVSRAAVQPNDQFTVEQSVRYALPTVLRFHLLRYGEGKKKIKRRFTFSQYIAISSSSRGLSVRGSAVQRGDSGSQYRLSAVHVHFGKGRAGGHWVLFVLDKQDGRWCVCSRTVSRLLRYKMDDSKRSQTTLATMEREAFGGAGTLSHAGSLCARVVLTLRSTALLQEGH